jgi:phenylalanyl-tRNA synthetase beta subunit
VIVGNMETVLKQMHQQLITFLKQMGVGVTVKQGLGQLPVELYHPVRQFTLMKENQAIGGFAEVHPRVLHKLGIEGKRVAIAEIPLLEIIK